jgi:hypothetical protein
VLQSVLKKFALAEFQKTKFSVRWWPPKGSNFWAFEVLGGSLFMIQKPETLRKLNCNLAKLGLFHLPITKRAGLFAPTVENLFF